ncbi:MAG TPA: DegV family protein [Mobilitalea sp.]|nr:DegV family protein [Mobilitalea sp.]
MNEYVIVSDATLDLPVEVIEEHNIQVIPMGVDIDNVSYYHHPDERDITIEAFYAKLKAGAISHTSQITPGAFIDFFTGILKSGLDIMYISFSSGLSGTYDAAQLVINQLKDEFSERRICCVDSLCASIGEGLLVYNAALQKQKGLDLEALKEWLEANKTRSRHWFTVKDLFYLKRGGRLTSLEAMVGTALKIRPVLSMDDQGKLDVVTKLRGSKVELQYMVNKMEIEGTDLSSQTVIVGHGDDIKQALALEKVIRSRNLVKDVIISKIGPIIGTHTGPGMLALVYMGKQSL